MANGCVVQDSLILYAKPKYVFKNSHRDKLVKISVLKLFSTLFFHLDMNRMMYPWNLL